MIQSVAALSSPTSVLIRIRRQDGPNKPPRWEEFAVPRHPGMNVVSCLRWITSHPVQADGTATTPPAWEADCLEDVCGACSMLINGKACQACSTLIDKLAEGDAATEAITLRPLSKFPVVRDLIVDRGRLFNDLKRVRAWVPIDGTHDLGPAAPMSRAVAERQYALSRCTHCACCLEACPQYTAANNFVGAAVISQAKLFNDYSGGGQAKSERLESLMEEGGIQDCAKAGNCVEVCPKDIPLLESIAGLQRQATVHVLRKFFTG